jgi:hypothetical protein
VPTHTKPLSDEDFGHYLAGLIDGDVRFSKYAAHIIFNGLDASLAYSLFFWPYGIYKKKTFLYKYIKKIKSRVGYGTVTKVKSKNAVILTITKREGLQVILNLINGKLRTQFKLEAINKYILNTYKNPLYLKDKFHLNTSLDLNNHWLAGFLDADGRFKVKTIHIVNPNGSTRLEIRLKYASRA